MLKKMEPSICQLNTLNYGRKHNSFKHCKLNYLSQSCYMDQFCIKCPKYILTQYYMEPQLHELCKNQVSKQCRTINI